MRTDQKILGRLKELVTQGEQVIESRRGAPPGVFGDDRVDETLTTQWVTSTDNILRRAFGEDSAHLRNFAEWSQGYVSYSSAVRALAVLRAAVEDWEGGYVFDVRKLVEAEIFDDFLEQAEHLNDNGYYQAAAVVAWAVLEDGMRKASAAHGIALPPQPKLDGMNAALAKAGMYSKLTQKRITMLADIRNKAAHGDWQSFTLDDVTEMLKSVRTVLGDLGV